MATCHQINMPHTSVSKALWHQFGQRHQVKVYHAQLKKQMYQKGKTLLLLAQDLEALVGRS